MTFHHLWQLEFDGMGSYEFNNREWPFHLMPEFFRRSFRLEVLALEEDFITDFKRRWLQSHPVVIFGHGFPSFPELLQHPCVNFLKPMSVQRSRWVFGLCLLKPHRLRVKPIIGVERGDSVAEVTELLYAYSAIGRSSAQSF